MGLFVKTHSLVFLAFTGLLRFYDTIEYNNKIGKILKGSGVGWDWVGSLVSGLVRNRSAMIQEFLSRRSL